MFGSRSALLVAGAVSALSLGGLATFLRLLPDSASTLPSAATFALVVVAVATGVVVGSRGVPDETSYW
ncbi:hypothetical protein [Halolamina salifodinae]|uniref:Uncharacterized protein n=1 Tax=Halolamina salifodinae TaxID=1202767 RepID=A0A8T4GYP3_9EURY|nr:hypothetical protein [Halolamina salifodinae]MBP1987530.1 hypothetical protein [Halolamina salifodinae]